MIIVQYITLSIVQWNSYLYIKESYFFNFIQVHIILSEVDNPEAQVECEVSSDEDDPYYIDPEEENLSDTDPEDEEWEVQRGKEIGL